jgi:isocitrate/isopropylmalate dehydrogenase
MNVPFTNVYSRKMSDGMFLSACREVSKEFPDVKYDEDLLDRVCLQVRIYKYYATATPDVVS